MFLCNNSDQTLPSAGSLGFGFQYLLRGPADVNALKIMFDPHIILSEKECLTNNFQTEIISDLSMDANYQGTNTLIMDLPVHQRSEPFLLKLRYIQVVIWL